MERKPPTGKSGDITVFVCLSFVFIFVEASPCASIVVPDDLATTEGNGGDIYPFGIRFTSSSMRYQQVFDASQFSEIRTEEVITAVLFRIDGFARSSFSWTLPRIQINLSTTIKSPGQLSTNFIEN